MPLFVRESGPDDAPTIVWLHGGGVSGWMWQEIVQLMGEYHALVPDLPGHGHSADLLPLSIQSSAALVADLIMSRAHGGRAYLVGLSFGGQIATALLSTMPDLAPRAVLAGTLARPIHGAHLLRQLYRLYAPLRGRPWLLQSSARALGIPERYMAEFAEDTRRLSPEGWLQLQSENISFAPPAALRRAEVPTLVAVGDHESAEMRRSALELSTVLPNGRGVLVRGAGPGWALQEPQRFALMVRTWLTEQPFPDGFRLL